MASTRRLAAILAADIVGYSRLMGLDEAGTAQAVRKHRAAADPLIAEHGGRIVKTTGDGILIELASVVGAVDCALALQHLAAERNAAVATKRRMEWRIGVHLGDVLIEGDEIARILEEEKPPSGVMHCFSSGRDLAEVAVRQGFYISISGIVTFRKAEELRAIVLDLPLERLLVETDASYLAPVPYRGKRNELAFVAATAATVAALKGMDPQNLAEITSANFFRLFGSRSARSMRVTVLGSGTSTGVPVIGNWGCCYPNDWRNHHGRVSALVEIGSVDPARYLFGSTRAAPRCRGEAARCYRELSAELPAGVVPGYDGLVVELPEQ